MPEFDPAVQEFTETIPSPLMPNFNYLSGAGYMQQLFSISILPFERGPTQLTHLADIQPRFYEAVSSAD
jgi:hypothetical protein